MVAQDVGNAGLSMGYSILINVHFAERKITIGTNVMRHTAIIVEEQAILYETVATPNTYTQTQVSLVKYNSYQSHKRN